MTYYRRGERDILIIIISWATWSIFKNENNGNYTFLWNGQPKKLHPLKAELSEKVIEGLVEEEEVRSK